VENKYKEEKEDIESQNEKKYLTEESSSLFHPQGSDK
jgi:hypothetical protein